MEVSMFTLLCLKKNTDKNKSFEKQSICKKIMIQSLFSSIQRGGMDYPLILYLPCFWHVRVSVRSITVNPSFSCVF